MTVNVVGEEGMNLNFNSLVKNEDGEEGVVDLVLTSYPVKWVEGGFESGRCETFCRVNWKNKELNSHQWHAQDGSESRIPDEMRAPEDWIAGSRSVLALTWKPQWPVQALNDVQRWGDSNNCRFLLTSEQDPNKNYALMLYVAPKPIRSVSGLDAYACQARDNRFETFKTWFEGFLVGRGLEP